jgi:hypothetical protein
MISYAVVVGSVIVGFSGFIIKGGVTDLANNMTSLADLAKPETLLPSFFNFLVVFLIGFTFFGFFHTVRWTYAHECHRQRVKRLTELMNPRSRSKIVWKDLDMDIPPMGGYPWPNLRKIRIGESLQKLIKCRQKCSKLWQRLKRLKKSKERREGFKIRYWFFSTYLVMLFLFEIVFPEMWSELWQRFREAFRTRYWFPALYFCMLILFVIIFPSPFKHWAIGCLVFAFLFGIGFFFSKPK